MISYFIQTFGCQMNEYESERIASMLEQDGMLPSNDVMNADIVILNTCSVREKAQHKVDSLVGKLRHNQAFHKLPKKIGIMGCVAQQVGDKYLKRFKCVDFVLGTDNVESLPNILTEIKKGNRIADTKWDKGGFSVSEFQHKKSLTAHVSIMKGCDNFCTYCIVPYVRGREKSRIPEEIIAEAKSLVENGVKDITLLGQNVNSYGKQFDVPVTFAELLELVAQIDGLIRLRFVTSHPKDFSIEMIKVMKKYENICPYLHLPLQSGSNKILNKMNRGYNLESYLNNINAAKELIPSLVFSSDFIVGFPSETEEDFEQTLEVIKKVEYESIFAFNYSVRPGTKAEHFEDDVPLSEKTRRLEIIIREQESISTERYNNLLGTKLKVLVEGPSLKDENVYTGRTVQNKIMNFTSNVPPQVGTEIEVTLTEVKRNSLYGEY